MRASKGVKGDIVNLVVLNRLMTKELLASEAGDPPPEAE